MVVYNSLVIAASVVHIMPPLPSKLGDTPLIVSPLAGFSLVLTVEETVPRWLIRTNGWRKGTSFELLFSCFQSYWMSSVHLVRAVKERVRWGQIWPEAEFLDEIQTKVLRGFPPCYSHHLYSFAWSISSNSHNLLQFLYVQLLYTVKGKGGKPDRKTILSS